MFYNQAHRLAHHRAEYPDSLQSPCQWQYAVAGHQRADSAASSDVQKDQGYQEVHLHLTRDHLGKHRLQYSRVR